MSSAAARTLSALTAPAQTFHEFQPIGGVSASLPLAATMVSSRDALPFALCARTCTFVVPGSAIEPEMMPVFVSIESPAGRPVAAKVSGASPVAGSRNRNGRPGVAPTMRGPLRRGVADALDARRGADSSTGGIAFGACAPSPAITTAPAQSASSSRLPSPASPTRRTICRAPVREISIGFAGSPDLTGPELNASLPSSQTSNVTDPWPFLRLSSMAPTACSRVAAPPRSYHSSVFEVTPRPC